MRIRVTAVTCVSDGAGGRYDSGQVADVDDGLAAAWIAAGHAEPADPEPTVEAPKRAVRRAPRRAANR